MSRRRALRIAASACLLTGLVAGAVNPPSVAAGGARLAGSETQDAVSASAGPVVSAIPARAFVADASSTWQTDEPVFALAGSNGVVYAGGEFATVRPPGAAPATNTTPRAAFAAFDATTGDLLPCAPVFEQGGDARLSIRALTVSPDGSLLFVGGRFNKADGIAVRNLAAIDLATCTVKRGYPRVNNLVFALAATPTTLYFGGDFSGVDGQTRTRLASISPTGTLQSWAPTANAQVRALTVAPSGSRVYAGGKFGTVNGSSISGLVALDPASGAVMQTFPGWIDVRNQEVKSLAHDDNNFYLGSEGTGAGAFDGRIAANVETGQQVWRDNCLGATQAVLPYQGLLFSASHAHDCSSTPGGYPQNAMLGRQHFLAQDVSNATITPWFPDTNEGSDAMGVGPLALAVADGVLWSGGMFTEVNNKPQQGLTRFRTGPDVGKPALVADPTASATSTSVTVNWQTSWDRDDGTLTYRLYRDGVSDPIYTASADSRYWSRSTLSFTDSGLPQGTYTYSVTVSDGPNTSASSTPVTATVVTTPTNYVPGSATSQSSTLSGISSSRAADNNTDGIISHGSVTHTNQDNFAWWQADLGATRSLRRVVIWNRTDCCSDRLSSFDVFLSPNPFTSNDPNVIRNSPGVTSVRVNQMPNPSLTVPVGVDARYVRVQLTGNGYLSLAEVQAFNS